jgi:hypothetical protein
MRGGWVAPRSRAHRQFDAIARGIALDKGGEANLSTVEKHLIENFAGIAVVINDINARLLLGEEVDLLELCTLSSTSVRLASRLGLGRRARDVTPTLAQYLDETAG